MDRPGDLLAGGSASARADHDGGRGRVQVDGKQFARAGRRFRFRGVTYGTFEPRAADGARFPDRARMDDDMAQMRDAGFTVVRTYTEPTEDLLESAADHGLYVLAGLFYADWRYMVGASGRERRRIASAAASEVRQAVRRLAGADQVLAVCLGNEIPADVVRWNGTDTMARAINRLVDVTRDEDPDRLVTYANYPTAEYLPLDGLDFLTFNVYLDRQTDFRRYLTRLHHIAGSRPLVLGEVGADSLGTAAGEAAQAASLGRQLETSIERGVAGTCVFSWTDEWWVGDAAVEGWHFGLTRADRSAKPALDVARQWNTRTVADLDARWPSISVVVCAYNAQATLAECLDHTTRLTYPNLEILVVDDGSTDATAEIARRYEHVGRGVRLVPIEHGGLSVARNAGIREATGELIAYLDSDAYPSPEWPYFLALGLDARTVGGVGGPNVAPVDDPLGAQAVACSPGGPAHVLTADDRAEHIPGCNMAFWKGVLEEAGGFNPVYTAAGDDVDVCWKVLDLGWEIGFHPAALVWHHRRAGLRPYLRQQRGYGRAEALVAARFTGLGTARWRGRIYQPGATARGRQRIYRGTFGSAAYQSVYAAPSHGLDIAHQVGVPLALASPLVAPLALLWRPAALVPVIAVLGLLGLLLADAWRARAPRRLSRSSRARFRAGVAVLHVLQPAARMWGRLRDSADARRGHEPVTLPGPVTRLKGGVLLFPEVRPRPETAEQFVACLRHARFRADVLTGWEDYDASVVGSWLVSGRLVTSAFPQGTVQARVRKHVSVSRLVPFLGAMAATWWMGQREVALIVGAWVAADLARGALRLGPVLRRALLAAARPVEENVDYSHAPAAVRKVLTIYVTHPSIISLDELVEEVRA
jgi:GT2 family glycosyltransferase/exo-beta-1,3-glucanase (GH17 family)